MLLALIMLAGAGVVLVGLALWLDYTGRIAARAEVLHEHSVAEYESAAAGEGEHAGDEAKAAKLPCGSALPTMRAGRERRGPGYRNS